MKVEKCKTYVYRTYVYTKILGRDIRLTDKEIKFNIPFHLYLKKGDRILFFYNNEVLYGKDLSSLAHEGSIENHNYLRTELYRGKNLLSEIRGIDMRILEAVREAQNSMLHDS